jgi:hypothetical protein
MLALTNDYIEINEDMTAPGLVSRFLLDKHGSK